MAKKIEFIIKEHFPKDGKNLNDIIKKFEKSNNENLANYIYQKAKQNLGLS